jgi:predicted  nucleic acid-binding Zn-ribbon protein
MKQVCVSCGEVMKDDENPKTAWQIVRGYCSDCFKKEMFRIVSKEREILDRERRKKEGKPNV